MKTADRFRRIPTLGSEYRSTTRIPIGSLWSLVGFRSDPIVGLNLLGKYQNLHKILRVLQIVEYFQKVTDVIEEDLSRNFACSVKMKGLESSISEREKKFALVYGCLNLIMWILIYHFTISNIEHCSSLRSINWRNPCSSYQHSSSSKWAFLKRHLRVRRWKTSGNEWATDCKR